MDDDGDSVYVFARNESNPLEADVIIIDEMSMVDSGIFYSLLKAVTPGTRLVLETCSRISLPLEYSMCRFSTGYTGRERTAIS